MSFSRGKFARLNENKDASHKASATSTTIKSGIKPRVVKCAPPTSVRNMPKLSGPVRNRSLSQPSSAVAIGSKMPRPCSVAGNKMNNMEADSSKADLDKTDDEIEFKSATVLQIQDLTKIDQKNNIDLKVVPAGDVEEIVNKLSETKNNSSAIPLRIKASQASNKDSVKTSKPHDARKFTISHSSNLSRPTTPRNQAAHSEVQIHSGNSLVTQFETKKKLLQALQEELSSKKNLISDSYIILVELKKKLEESGVTNVELDELKSECELAAVEPKLIENMTNVVNKIPSTLIDLCKDLMRKRLIMLNALENFSKNKVSHDELQKSLKTYKDDTAALEKIVNDHAKEQQQHAKNLVQKWAFLVSSSGDAYNISNQIEELQTKLKLQEQQIDAVKNELQQAIQQSELFEKKSNQAEQIVTELKEKIKRLEGDLGVEKSCVQSQKEKSSGYDQKLKIMKSRVQEMESKFKESENKYNDLQKSCKHTNEQIKSNEHRWMKEKEELLSKNKHDKQMLEKLTKDRSCFETRVKSLEERIEECDKTQITKEAKFQEDVEEARKLALEEKVKRETLQEKYDHVQSQLVHMEIRNREAVGIVTTKHTFEPKDAENISTNREAELYTELLATRVGLKAAEEKLQNFHKEKLRFLDTLQSLQGEHKESVAPLQKDFKITELENSLNEKDKIICRQNLEISGLNVEIENLTLKSNTGILQTDSYYDGKDESELKCMLHEGKIKLEQLLKKSSENEQKANTYKYDLDKRNKQFYEMENLLKARDGLVTVIKAKKDELQLENASLNKYANKIRELLIESREEARIRNELVQELTTHLDAKGRACEQQEKLINELQCSLSLTSEKRFKLQDTIGAMEKELQRTKAHILKMTSETINRPRLKSNS